MGFASAHPFLSVSNILSVVFGILGRLSGPPCFMEASDKSFGSIGVGHFVKDLTKTVYFFNFRPPTFLSVSASP